MPWYVKLGFICIFALIGLGLIAVIRKAWIGSEEEWEPEEEGPDY